MPVTVLLALVTVGALPAASGGAPASITVTWSEVFGTDSTLDPHNIPASKQITNTSHQMYDTLVTFKGTNFSNLVPHVARTWKLSKDAKTLTMQLRRDVRFADGARLTSADVVFTMHRFVNMRGPFSFWLSGVTVAARGPYEVVFRMTPAKPALPYILAHPFLGIMNSKLLRANGGTDAPDAATTDKASTFFKTQSAGSGPYMLEKATPRVEIILTVNPRYWGPKPVVTRVIINNVPAATQLLTIQRASHSISADITSRDAAALRGNRNVTIKIGQAPNVWFFGVSKSKTFSPVTANKHIQNAIRYAIDYKGLLDVVGPGSIQAPGLVAQGMLGALPMKEAVKRDLAKARAEVAKAAADGITNPSFTIDYPSGGYSSVGVVFQSVAERIASSIQEAGINVRLVGSPSTTWIPKWVGQQTQAVASQYPVQYPDPSQYEVFFPGGVMAVRFHWRVNSNRLLESLARQGERTVTPKGRAVLYQAVQRKMNEDGPIYPLFQPALVVAHTSDLTNVNFNPVFVSPDFASIKAK